MADKIVVMHDGIVEQIGAPLDLYDRPRQPVRRRLHRLAGDELPAGRDRRRRRAVLPRRGRRLAAAGRRGRRRQGHARGARHPARSICRLSDDGLSGRGRRRRADRLGDPDHRPHAGRRGDRREFPRAPRISSRARRSGWPPSPASSICSTAETGQRLDRLNRTDRHGHERGNQGGNDDEVHQTRCDPHDCRVPRRASWAAGLLGSPAFAQDALTFTPEDGATLRLLRWSPFVKGDEDRGSPTPRSFTDATGVAGARRQGKLGGHPPEGGGRRQCRLRPGHHVGLVRRRRINIPTSCSTSPISPTISATNMAAGTTARRATPRATASSSACRWRPSATPSSIATAGSRKPASPNSRRTPAGFLELCKALQKIGHPAGFTHGHGVGDGNNYAHWLLWSHGGKMVDESGKVVDQQPRDAEGDRIRAGALQDLHPGHRKLARRQQQPRLPRRRTRRHRQRHLGLLHRARSTRTTIRSSPRSPRTSAPPTCRSARSASRSSCTRPPRR